MYVYLCLYSPSSVFVVNHTSPDDFQPLSLREMHSELHVAAIFQGAKVNIAGKCMCVPSHNNYNFCVHSWLLLPPHTCTCPQHWIGLIIIILSILHAVFTLHT